MSVTMSVPDGNIVVSNEAIAQIIGAAVTDNYGVVGMVSKNFWRDNIIEILGIDNYTKGIVLNRENEKISVDIYIVVSYGTKISMICQNIQETVKYNVERLLGFQLDYVNVHVQDVLIDAE